MTAPAPSSRVEIRPGVFVEDGTTPLVGLQPIASDAPSAAMRAHHEETLAFGRQQNLGAFKGATVLGDMIVYNFERGRVTDRLPAGAR